MSQGEVIISYADLVSRPETLAPAIEKAFGSDPECLGLLIVTDLPADYKLKRRRLLLLAERFGRLPQGTQDKYVDEGSKYCFGWSHGREIMNGKPDTMKGSFYANPIVDDPKVPEELKRQFPEYYRSNIWPEANEKGVEEFEDAFKDLGKFIFKVGSSSHLSDQSISLASLLSTSQTTKARLLHYYPPKKPDDGAPSLSEWCGTHLDNSMLTGLCSAMYLKHQTSFPPSPSDVVEEVPSPSPDAGLYIHTRGGEVKKASIPPDALAFQTGEALELCTAGRLRATPHLVSPGSWTAGADEISRETFALFMQPDTSQVLSEEETFGSFSKRIFSKHYDAPV
ncbi:hypothetical protein FRB98_004842 [Tulasnella sp. 332]|nr:hypothetical protein FRB98_004842 [Tulasnella sp. 332]